LLAVRGWGNPNSDEKNLRSVPHVNPLNIWRHGQKLS
jgi:hypothetical protein